MIKLEGIEQMKGLDAPRILLYSMFNRKQ